MVFANVRDAKAQGIALIHQELMLAPNLDITSNIFLGNEQAGGGLLRPLDRRRMRAQAELLIARVGLQIPVTTLVSQLTAGQKQMVEIAKALSANARILIMDEPTSSLGSEESEQLFKIIHQLEIPKGSASSTSPTAWARCWRFPTASPCYVTDTTCRIYCGRMPRTTRSWH